jgi:O-antigen/teichoic acid export membrane protein
VTTTGAGALGVRAILRQSVGILGLSTAASLLDGAAAVMASRQLGAESRGVYAVVLTLAGLTAAISCLGVPTSGRVRIARPEDAVRLPGYLAVVPVHVLAGGLLSGLVTWLLGVVALSAGSFALVIAGGALGGALVASTFRISALQGVGEQSQATGANAAGSLAMVVLTGGLVAIGNDDPAAYLWALAASRAVQAVLCTLLLRSHLSGRQRYRWDVHRLLLVSGAPSIPYQLTTIATFRIDRYFVGAFAGVTAAGIYSVAATLSEMARMVPTAVGQVLLYGRSSGTVSPRSERRSRRLVLWCAWTTLLGIGLAAPWLVDLLFGDEFADAVEPLRILLVAEAFLAAWLIDNRLLIGGGRLGAASVSTVVSSVVVIVGDLVLIPAFELTGAAAASVLGYAAAWWTARRLLLKPDPEARPAAAGDLDADLPQ